MRRVLLGHVPVDTATLLITDPTNLEQWTRQMGPEFFEQVHQLAEKAGTKEGLNGMIQRDPPEVPFSEAGAAIVSASKRKGGMVGEQNTLDYWGDGVDRTYALGIAASTGMGDGLYPVYALVTEENDVEAEFGVGRVAAIVVDCMMSESVDRFWKLIEQQAEGRMGETAGDN